MKLRLSLLGLLLVPWLPSCSSGQCPTIACVPKVQGSYSRVIADPYRLALAVNSTPFAANCPMTTDLGLTPGIAACSDSGFIVTGLDLGHGENSFVSVEVTINNSQGISTSGQLQGIANSRDCALVCYEHTVFISN